jgi:hypothetical protein
MSPTRPPSVRKRQSIQIMDLQTQLDQLAAHNSSLENAKAQVEETLQAAQYQRQIDEQVVAEAAEARDREIRQRDIDIAQLKDTLQRLREEIARLTELNNTLNEANRNLIKDTNERYAQLQAEGQLVQQQNERYAELQAEGQLVQQQWQTSQRELEQLRAQHEQMTRGIEGTVRDEIGIALDDRNAEIDRLNAELNQAKEEIKTLQKQILASKKPSESFLTIRDEDYFDSACQQLCQHVQQWVLRFSKFSDTRPCRLTSEIAADTRIDTATRQKIDTRLDNAILDGSDVDSLLADRVKRRDVFMSVVMTMIWEYVFTRYLFGMDREQRQKLKSLEKTLSEVGKYMVTSLQWIELTMNQDHHAPWLNGELLRSPFCQEEKLSCNSAPKTPKLLCTKSTAHFLRYYRRHPTSSGRYKNHCVTLCALRLNYQSKCARNARNTSCFHLFNQSMTPTATWSPK